MMPSAHDSLLPSPRLRLRIAAVALAVAVSQAHADTIEPVAGSVTFVIGAVHIVNAAGESRAAAAGEAVAAGDRIVTAAGQHVHVRFVDGGFVSVRPGSRLAIEQYDTGPDAAIRFNLEHGVVRSITGEAAQARKERFRLNTPLAAIGVRGTDFVVQANAGGLRAVVNQGAIVVAPFVGGCAVQALGPCLTAEARELTDDMGRVLLELTAMQPARIVPIGGTGPDQSAPPAPQEPTPEHALVTAVETAGADRAATALQPVPETPPLPPTEPTQLQWGRWGGAAHAGDTLSVDRETARDGRKITVGNNYVGLYRPPGDSPVLSTQLGQGSFSLAGGEVSLLRADGVSSPGRVNGGWLKIDFAQRRFATDLSLSHAATGAVSLQSSGQVRDDGIFAVQAGDTRVAGAVSFDGREAGYLFDKALPQGTLSGSTLWRR